MTTEAGSTGIYIGMKLSCMMQQQYNYKLCVLPGSFTNSPGLRAALISKSKYIGPKGMISFSKDQSPVYVILNLS